MKLAGLLTTFVAALLFVLPGMTAQEQKKDDVKKEEVKKDETKKDDVKKDETKKDEKKDPEKKDPEKKEPEKKEPEKKIAPEKLVYSSKMVTKIMSLGGMTSRELTIERQEIDQKKVQDMQTWSAAQIANLNKQKYDASIQKDPKARFQAMQSYQKNLYSYQMDLAKRQNNVYSAKPFEVRATENAKVRSFFPPVEFDDQGFLKKWTKKELEERRDKSGLPGFGVDFEALKSGQMVEIYFAKAAPKTPMKKKGPDDDDTPLMKGAEFVLIVILQESGK